jgi:hypothetical protein
MDTKKEVIGSLASVIGRTVGSFLDTKSPRLVTYRVTSKPFHYVDVDDGEPLHEYPVTASFQFTITMHPDHSVEGVTTMEEDATNRMSSYGTECARMARESGHRYPLTASCFFSATEEGSSTCAIMHYDTGLTIEDTRCRAFKHIDDLEKRAELVEWKTKELQTMLATSKMCEMMFEQCGGEYLEQFSIVSAQVTIFKSPFSIEVSRWSRGAFHFDDDGRDQEGCIAARVNFEVASIEMVKGITVATPVFS